MKLLIFTQHFPPETVATGRRAFDLAESMARRGHSVTVVTGYPNHPSSLTRPFCRTVPRSETTSAGYRVLRVPVFRSENTRTLHRFLTYGTFALSAAWAGLRQEIPDAILAVSPLPTGLAAMAVHWWRRVPLVFDLQDIWPDSALAVGVLGCGCFLRWLRRLERFFYFRCALIVGITEGFRGYLLRLGVQPDHVAVVPNGVDSEAFGKAKDDHEFARPAQHRGRFVVGYAGNIGLAQGLGTLLEAAESLRNDPVEFLLVGEGSDKGRLLKLSRVYGLENLRFLDGVPRGQVATMLAACDALLLILRDNPIFEITIPSKLYEYMAAGKPIICSVGGESAGVVASCGCGLPVTPSDAAALVSAVRKLRDNPTMCRHMGEMGKRSARERFSRDGLMVDYAELVERLGSSARKPVTKFALRHVKSVYARKP